MGECRPEERLRVAVSLVAGCLEASRLGANRLEARHQEAVPQGACRLEAFHQQLKRLEAMAPGEEG